MTDLNDFLSRKARDQARSETIAAWHVNAHVTGGVPLPYTSDDTWLNVNVHEYNDDDGEYGINVEKTLDALGAIADYVMMTPGVEAEKEYDRSDFEINVQIADGITLRYHADREAVCTKKIVGYEDVPEKITPAYKKEIVEWECDPISLVARGKANKRVQAES